MTLYIDASAFLKLYFDEPDSPARRGDPHRRPRVGDGTTHGGRGPPESRARAAGRRVAGGPRRQFDRDWLTVSVVEPTDNVCEAAAEIAEVTGARTLDALHLGAAREAGGGALPFVTFDLRQAQIARSLGWIVLGS